MIPTERLWGALTAEPARTKDLAARAGLERHQTYNLLAELEAQGSAWRVWPPGSPRPLWVRGPHEPNAVRVRRVLAPEWKSVYALADEAGISALAAVRVLTRMESEGTAESSRGARRTKWRAASC